MVKIIAGNWKMYGGFDFLEKYLNELKKHTFRNEVILSLPYVFLDRAIKNNSSIKIASQDVSSCDKITSTGEISAKMLSDIGVKYSIIGHSERRCMHDSDDSIRLKLKNISETNIVSILCIGESLKEKNENRTNDILKRQIDVLNGLKINRVIVAYEPVWAIGTGLTPTSDEIFCTIDFIKSILREFHFEFKVLYGGSVNEQNCKQILNINNLDGVLVGGASLDARKFISIATC